MEKDEKKKALEIAVAQRGKGMRLYQRFLMVLAIFIFSKALAQENLPAIIKQIEPSIVVILTYNKKGEALGQGSGFFISKAGDVVTNRHVLQGASSAKIKTAKGKVYPVTLIVAEDREGDIVRVSVGIPKEEVYPLIVKESIPEVGERVIVIGNPLGLEQTVSDGIVSAVRDIPSFGKIIQITAPISAGSSGSPVVNMKGEVIGIATFQIIGGQNLNFAIPGERIVSLKPDKGKTIIEWSAGETKEWLTSAEGLYATGLIFLWVEDYEGAFPYFKKAVEKRPDYAEAYFQIGYCCDEIGSYTDAIKAYKQAIRIKPDYAEAHNNLGAAYGSLGRYTEEIEAFKQAIRIKPDYAETHYNLGVAYRSLGRYDEAIEAFKQAIRIKPDYADTHYGLGLTYGSLGRHKEEIEAYKQAIRIKPDFAEAHYFLGVNYGELGLHTEAIKAFKQAIRIKPDYAKAHYGLGLTYGSLGRYDEAIEAYKQAIRIKPDFAEAHYFLGVAYRKLGLYTEAIKSFKQAIRINPDYAEAHCNLGVAYWFLGDRGSALDEYRILKELDKDLANKLFNLIYE